MRARPCCTIGWAFDHCDDPVTGKPDAFYARVTNLAATDEVGTIHEVTSPDDNLQAVFQYLVK